jgi:disulfide bond formation protein DsbB
MLARREFAPAFIFVVGLATILGAWGFQIIGHYVPCKLCLEERWPYYIGLPIALIALILSLPAGAGASPWLRRGLLIIVALVFAYGAWLGTYHAGAEWTWWPGPTDCGGGTQGGSGQELLNQIQNIRVVSCTDASFRFPPVNWGLSFAGWNAVISAVLALVAAWGAARPST